jgi:outer membrane biosynthesis protein TonB
MEPESGTPSAGRLVIRIKLPSSAPPPVAVRRGSSRSALLLMLGAGAVVLLGWLGISLFRTDPTPAPTPVAETPKSPTPAAAPTETAPQPATATAVTKPPAATPPINEVIPDVARSARQTIRGRIRVSIRVIVDSHGTVLAATADEPGPSRYFERLSVEAAKKWTFPPAASVEPRVMLVRFYFTRTGTTARVSSPQ